MFCRLTLFVFLLGPFAYSQCEDWRILNPEPLPYRYDNMIWDGNQFVSLTFDEQNSQTWVGTSATGLFWNQHVFEFGYARRIAFNGEKYMVLGHTFTAVSTDLVNWTVNTRPGSNSIGLAAGNGFWVTSFDGRINHSDDDGQTWTLIDNSEYFQKVASFDGTLIAVSREGTIKTSVDGINWTSRYEGGTWMNEIIWNGSMAVVTPWGGQHVYTSTDMINWTARDFGYQAMIYSAAWTGSHFVICSGTNFAISPNGIDWEPISSDAPSSTLFWSMASNGTYTLAGTNLGRLYISTDVNTWIHHQNPLAGIDLNTAASLNGNVIAFRHGIRDYLHSSNGRSWQKGSLPNAGFDVATYEDTFVLAAANGRIGFSEDGLSWTFEESGTIRHFSHVAVSSDLIMVVNVDSETLVRSISGGSWKQVDPLPGDINTLSASSTGFLAGGPSGVLYSSSNGTNWQTLSIPTDVSLNDIIYNPNLDGDHHVIVGESANILFSTDGVNWDLNHIGGNDLYSVTATSNGYIAGGESGLLRSDDGQNWTALSGNAAAVPSNAVTWSGTAMVSVSNDGMLLVSGSAPQITQQPVDQQLCPGDSFELTVTAEDVLSYQWRLDGVDIPGAEAATYAVAQADLTQSGVYNCVMQNACSGTVSEPAVVRFNLESEGMTFDGVGQGLDPVTLSFTFPCDLADVTVTWIREDDEIVLATDTADLQIDPTPLVTTSYRAEIYNPIEDSTQILRTVILVSDNPLILDPNGDGCNTPADLQLAGSDWGSFSSDYETDGNPGLDIRDLLHINTSGAPCAPAR